MTAQIYELIILEREDPILAVMVAFLRNGQSAGVFRSFRPHMVGGSIWQAINEVHPLYVANPNLRVALDCFSAGVRT